MSDVTSAPGPVPPERPVIYAFGPFRLDVAGRRLLKNDVPVQLTAKVFDTLVLLVVNHNSVVTKEQIVQAVWPNTFVSDDSLVQNISAIRRALGDDPTQSRYIATLARRGYRFVSHVEEHTIDPRAGSGVSESRGPEASTAPPRPSRLLAYTAAALAVGLGLGIVIARASRPTVASIRSPLALRFQESLPPGQILEGGLALSPDGQYLAFVARDQDTGARRIWLRILNSDSAMPIEESSDSTAPFWSPDSEYLGYSAGRHLKRISVAGGTPQPLAPLDRGTSIGGSWGRGDRILYIDRGKILCVSASGGAPSIEVDGNRLGLGELRWPHFLPDGRHFVFVVNSDFPSRSAIYLGELDSHNVVRLMDRSDSAVAFAAPDHLIYIRDHTLMAQRFDPAALRLLGDPKPILGDLPDGVDLSAEGALIAVAEHKLGARAVWFDRSGTQVASFKVPKVFTNVAISPDGRRALATSSDNVLDLWEIDLTRNSTTRLIPNAGFPEWSPDGTHFAFISVGAGGAADLRVRSTTDDEDAVWLKNDDMKIVDDWSRDGRYVVFENLNDTRRGLWLLAAAGDHSVHPLLLARGRTSNGRLSPIGQAVAYVSDESGIPEVYLESNPGDGPRYQVSSGGGAGPVWRSDGGELYYISADKHLNAVALSPDSLTLGKPQPLFSIPGSSVPFAVADNGRRFLAILRDRSGDYGSITVLTAAAAGID
jgi:DNA-binding winged helix-turn-helix (wHTH) protein/Tol biopolymer transport system component